MTKNGILMTKIDKYLKSLKLKIVPMTKIVTKKIIAEILDKNVVGDKINLYYKTAKGGDFVRPENKAA